MANSKLTSIMDYQEKVLRTDLLTLIRDRDKALRDLIEAREVELRQELFDALQIATNAQQALLRAALEPLIEKVEAALDKKEEGLPPG